MDEKPNFTGNYALTLSFNRSKENLFFYCDMQTTNEKEIMIAGSVDYRTFSTSLDEIIHGEIKSIKMKGDGEIFLSRGIGAPEVKIELTDEEDVEKTYETKIPISNLIKSFKELSQGNNYLANKESLIELFPKDYFSRDPLRKTSNPYSFGGTIFFERDKNVI